jgi:NAD(P)-dependent dehydrogenase (short-subunit alcohol dehydrogenase family)
MASNASRVWACCCVRFLRDDSRLAEHFAPGQSAEEVINHFDNGGGESSKIVSTFSENFGRWCLPQHFHTWAYASHVTRFESHSGNARCRQASERSPSTRGSCRTRQRISRLPAASGFPGYDVAKLGVIRLTTGVAQDVAKDGIRVNCLAPGWIASDGPRQYWESLTPIERAERGVPSKLLSTEEIAEVVLRLATDRSLNGRVVVWWSEDPPRLIQWGDRGYRDVAEFPRPPE